jgi:initiation factor 1A
MVKNQNGGNKSKKMGRKFITAPVDRKVRLAMEDGELYASVTKMLGNGMFMATCPEGKERLVVMRNKFRGRGKRDNTVAIGSWVLIGERDFESCAKPKHDLLEVYTDIEREKLKRSGDPIFAKLKTDQHLFSGKEADDNIAFGNSPNDKTDELDDTIDGVDAENPYLNTSVSQSVIMEDGESVDVDDI